MEPDDAPARDLAGAAELIPGTLYALGGLLPLDGRLSWVADGVEGVAPLASYLLVEDGRALLIDTGAPVFEAQLLAQLDALVPRPPQLSVLLSRVVEFDSFGNAAAVLRHLPVDTTYSQFPPDEWLYYRHVHGTDEPPAPTRWVPLKAGVQAAIGGEGDPGRRLETLHAPLRLLVTAWMYDPATRCLFTSDAFGHAVMPDAGGPRTVTAETDTTTLDEVRDHLVAKFDWLETAELEPLREQLAEVFGEREIDMVAPSYGRVLVGRDVVQRHYELVQEALAGLGAGAATGGKR